MSDSSKRVAIVFYTGEYTGVLTKALADANCWHRVVDSMTFSDGYDAARKDAGLEALPLGAAGDAWGEYLKQQIEMPKEQYIFTETSPLEMASTVIFTWAGTTMLFDAACRFANVLRKVHVGGDDETFDYYPDAMEALYQLCLAIGGDAAKAVYLETRQAAWDELYKDIGEVDHIDRQFPGWAA